ncbi:TIGR03087 family PEP-CTERM/XrtA system glycosyltransferase [Candidatus Nitrosacidococcus tergens]|uniref:Sugar transferase, PEP-CTERM/EpsH1 system associated n=1 Tax=Candidatus Nitrosacidococcus tergens TaxID=553981 RepID=A0A7G1QBP2_9GAMM|nr:TIGR03087 family PEP-CTERM/XrtA system glycosyltransferase [Candidatus Nitrosacidococcus tergens]CAB1276777.1 Sugar transferase, PEP-CTERM/EpsH1 system associated [Candidatus Nitrosacidococcus tergens]
MDIESKGDLLFLAHRIPYPPNKGDKIRSYHLLSFLARYYRVHVGAFIDDPEDWQYVSHLQALCKGEALLRPLSRNQALFRSLVGLTTKKPLGLAYYQDDSMTKWVQEIARCYTLKKVFIFSSTMAQYLKYLPLSLSTIVDFVDVDSEKWRAYSKTSFLPLSWIYKREANALLDFEKEIASQVGASIFVSQAEAKLFCTLAPDLSEKIFSISNGVDIDFFSPDHCFPSPYNPESKVLVFTGAMDYRPNIDAVVWFTKHIFPKILKEVPSARFYIVGSHPAKPVRALISHDHIYVTGSVPDVRPYLAHASGVVAPLRIARGIQNKMLEAMAMAKPILATPEAAEGIELPQACHALIGKGIEELVTKGVNLLQKGDELNAGKIGRNYVLNNYCWEHHLQSLSQLPNK